MPGLIFAEDMVKLQILAREYHWISRLPFLRQWVAVHVCVRQGYSNIKLLQTNVPILQSQNQQLFSSLSHTKQALARAFL